MKHKREKFGFIYDGPSPTSIRREKPKVNGKRKREVVWECPYYVKWDRMTTRCFDLTFKEKYPSYREVSCCDEWRYFSNFKSWMEQQDWEGKELDKDFLCVGKDKIYSPETCVFMPHTLNIFLTLGKNNTGNLPIGVYLHKNGRYVAQIKTEQGTTKYLGTFTDPLKGHFAWLKEKHKICLQYMETYK